MIVKEFLPNPVGADKDGEYIKIFNDSDKAVNLAGWKINDASKKEFSLSGTINPKEELVLFSAQTKISLNNNGEVISLIDPKGVLVDQLAYTGAIEEGKVILKQEIGITRSEFENGEVLNMNFPSSIGKILTLDIFLGVILGVIAVYVILQLEKRFGKNLY
ncbi:MAG: lamin tail domain-containing protein [Minisyncoccota bacterium]